MDIIKLRETRKKCNLVKDKLNNGYTVDEASVITDIKNCLNETLNLVDDVLDLVDPMKQ